MSPISSDARRELAASQYNWAVRIVTKHFDEGIKRTFDRHYVEGRPREFKAERDPIYSRLLESTGRDIYQTFVGFWKLGQTMATQSRFWLEAAICDIVRRQRKRFGREVVVYSFQDLVRSSWNRDLADMGEAAPEWSTAARAFRVGLSREVLECVEHEVGRQERRLREPDDKQEAKRIEGLDREVIARLPELIGRPPWDVMPLNCNLLVVQPEPGQVHAIRYVNEKGMTPAEAGREKANLLRLFAWLCQEKILRRPGELVSVTAQLVPRGRSFTSRREPAMFSPLTRWSHDELWTFIGVPYEVVELGVERSGARLRKLVSRNLASILPERLRRRSRDSAVSQTELLR